MRLGYTLFTEDHDPRNLVDHAQQAEDVGFGFLASSDHFHPWLKDHDNSCFAWSLLGAVAERTNRIELSTMVTTPTFRYHPVIVAQAAATLAVMSDGRFSLGVGAGERLNEHVVGTPWDAVDVRHDKLEEAIELMRTLWQGGYQTYRGEYYTAEDARIFTLPDEPPDVLVAASGPRSAELAGRCGNGMIAIAPDRELVDAYRRACTGDGLVRGQVVLCYDEDEERALCLAHQKFRFGLLGWKVMSELPNVVQFDAATELSRPEDMAGLVTCGPDPAVHAAAIREFEEAGFDELSVLAIGPDQEGFFRFWDQQLEPEILA